MIEERKERRYRDGVLDVDAPAPVIVFYIIWACLYGYFALRFDDDPEVCIASPDSNQILATQPPDSEDIGEKFRYCFDRFFYLTLLQIAIATLTHIFVNDIFRQFLFLIMLLSSYAFIGLWIYIVIKRFSWVGQVCSGDFLTSE